MVSRGSLLHTYVFYLKRSLLFFQNRGLTRFFIKGILFLKYTQVQFETFEDSCSTFVYIPALMEKAGAIEFVIKHPQR
jgi:hypothetical protein